MSEFTLTIPAEEIEDYIKTKGIEDGVLLEHQQILIENSSFDEKEYYVIFEGKIISKRLDS